MRIRTLARLTVLLFGGLGRIPMATAGAPTLQGHNLPNGFEVLVVENHAVPLVTIEVVVKNGAMTESPAYSGLSHLYEHMFFKGNKAFPSQEAFVARKNALGIESNATTDVEQVTYYLTTTSDHLEEAMAFMRDALLSPRFDEREFAREKVIITQEMDRLESKATYHLAKSVDQALWWKHPNRKLAIGTRKSILAATTRQMRVIQRRYYVPNNAALIVTGDVRAETVIALAGWLYQSWQRSADPFRRFPPVKHPPLERPKVLVVPGDVETATGVFAWQGPSTAKSDLMGGYAADILTGITLKGASKFQKALVDSGACLAANLIWRIAVTTGPVKLSFRAAVDKVNECVTAIAAELPRLKEESYLSAREMKAAVDLYRLGEALERERPSQFAHILSGWWATAGLDYYQNYVSNLAKVTQHDIARYLETYILDKPYVFGVLLPPEAVARGLDRRHFARLLGIDKLAKTSVRPPARQQKSLAARGK